MFSSTWGISLRVMVGAFLLTDCGCGYYHHAVWLGNAVCGASSDWGMMRSNIMQSYKHSDPDADKSRTHPWTVAESDATQRYYDFKSDPALIRIQLEDFLGVSDWCDIQTFYSLLEWLNGPNSTLESNDCAFKPPRDNKNPRFKKSLECTGRIIILYRLLHLNTHKASIEWLEDATHHYLGQIDPGFRWV